MSGSRYLDSSTHSRGQNHGIADSAHPGEGAEPLALASAKLDAFSVAMDQTSKEVRKTLDSLADHMTAVHNLRLETVKTLKDHRQQLEEDLAKARGKSEPPLSREQQTERVRQAENEKEKVIADILAAQQELEKLKAEKNEILESADSVKGKREEIENRAREELPALKEKLNLYTVLSGAKLYLGNDGLIKGFVCSREQDGVEPFHYDLSSATAFESTNRIWSHI